VRGIDEPLRIGTIQAGQIDFKIRRNAKPAL